MSKSKLSKVSIAFEYDKTLATIKRLNRKRVV